MTESDFKELLTQVERYSSYGWTCIPLTGKTPLISWSVYKYQNATKEEQLNHFYEHKQYVTGIGVMCGLAHNLAVLDLEEGEDFERFKIPEGCPTARSGGNGRHYFFRFPDELTVEHNKGPLGKYGIKGDILLNCGLVTVSPSIHPDTKKKYEWIIEPTGAELPDMPKELLELLLNSKGLNQKTDWASTEMVSVPEGMRHNTGLSIAGKLVQQTPESDWEEFVLPQLLAWNQGACTPPMDAEEVVSIYNSVCKMQKNSKPISNLVSSPKSPRAMRTFSMKELFALSEEDKPLYVVDKLIPEKGISYIYGAPGCGKSLVMLEMVKAIANGSLFLDKVETRQTNVLIVDEENGEYELKRRAGLLGISDNMPIQINPLNGFKFDDEKMVAELMKFCKDINIGMVIFDPFASTHTAEENSATEMRGIMEVMQEFNLAGITVLFIHHSRKNGHGGGAQNSRGSSAILARADSTLTVTKSSRGSDEVISITQTKSRRGKASEPLHILVSQLDEKSPIQMTLGEGIGEAVVKKDQARDVVLDILNEGPMLRQDIINLAIDASKIGDRNIISAIKELENEGLISFIKKGRQYEYSLQPIPLEIQE